MTTSTLARPVELLPAQTIDGKKPTREQVPKGEVLCSYCTAKCCRYFALPIDAPTTQQDLDFIRWYLLHDRATVFIEDGTWYLLVHTDCKHLQADHRCGIYHTRPQICRDYSTDNCEFDEDAVYEMYFETSEQVAEYMEARFHSADLSSIRSPEPSLLPILS
jgi:Fe-S-cluster containining protein